MASRFNILLLALAALFASTQAFAPQNLPQCPATTNGKESSTKLNVYNSYGYGRDWDYDYGGSLAYGTGQYRQRYNDGYSGGVNSSYNGYSQQSNDSYGMARYGYGYGRGIGRGYGGYGRYDGYGSFDR